MKHIFNYTDDKSHKFWAIEVNGAEFTVTYGKAGTSGQTQTKSFADEAASQKEANKLIAEKIKKGYVEEGSGAVADSKPAVNPTDTPNPPIEILTKEEALQKFNYWEKKKLYAFAGDYIFYCKGDLTLEKCRLDWVEAEGLEFVETDKNKSCAGLIVEGNLNVKTCIKNGEIDFGQVLYVTGDVHVKNVMIGGAEVYIEGNLDAAEIVWTTYNHGYLTVEKNLTAKLAIFEDHYTSVKGNINALAVIDNNSHGDAILPPAIWDYSSILAKTVLTKNEYYEKPPKGEDPEDYEAPYEIDGGKLYEALEQGKNVLKPQKETKQASKANGFDVMKKVNEQINAAKETPIKRIDITYQKFRELPDEFFNIKDIQSITALSFEGSLLQTLPSQIELFVNLEELNISATKITRLPDEIGNLKKLKKLFINGCKLKSLPVSLLKLESIEKLYMRQLLATLDRLPDFSHLPNLKVLSLSMKYMFNNLSKEQLQAIFNLKLDGLEELNMEDCSLKKENDQYVTYDMPASISGFTHLKELNVSNCSLCSIPDEIASLKLEKLNIHGNYLTHLKIDRLKQLLPHTQITGEDNQIIFPASGKFYNLTSEAESLLQKEDVAENDFKSIWKLLEQARDLVQKRFEEEPFSDKDIDKMNGYLYSVLSSMIESKQMECRHFNRKKSDEVNRLVGELFDLCQNCLKLYDKQSSNPATEDHRVWMLIWANFGMACYYYYTAKSREDVERGLPHTQKMIEIAGDGNHKNWAITTSENMVEVIKEYQNK